MASARSAVISRDLIPPHAEARPRSTLLKRMLKALMAARARTAEREIERYLTNNGGKFTDETEREIERRFLNNSRW